MMFINRYPKRLLRNVLIVLENRLIPLNSRVVRYDSRKFCPFLNNQFCNNVQITVISNDANSGVAHDIVVSNISNGLISELTSTLDLEGDSERLHKLFDDVLKEIDNFDLDAVLRLLSVLRRCVILNSHLKTDVRTCDFLLAIDTFCCERFLSRDKDTQITLALALVDAQIKIKLRFCCVVVRRLFYRFDQLENRYCVGCLTIICRYRWWRSPFLNFFHLEDKFNRCFDEFRENEITLFLTVFNKRLYIFKRVDILTKLVDYISTTSANNIRRDSLKRVFHTLALNCLSLDADLLRKVRRAITIDDNVDDIELLVNLTKLYKRYGYCDEEILSRLASLYERSIDSISITLMDHVIQTLTFFNFLPDKDDQSTNEASYRCVYRRTLDEICSESRTKEGSEQPKTLLRIISNISCVDVYRYDILNQALSVEYLKAVFGKRLTKHSIPSYVFMLNSNVHLDRPDYDGCKLDRDICSSAASIIRMFLSNETLENTSHYLTVLADVRQHLSHLLNVEHNFLDRPSNVERGLDRTLNVVDAVDNNSFVRICCVLPHVKLPDIVFTLKNSNKVAQPVLFDDRDDWFLRPYVTDSKEATSWYCVLMANKDDVPPVGPNVVKMRQLPKLGYKCILLSSKHWQILTSDQKLELLKNKIDEAD